MKRHFRSRVEVSSTRFEKMIDGVGWHFMGGGEKLILKSQWKETFVLLHFSYVWNSTSLQVVAVIEKTIQYNTSQLEKKCKMFYSCSN